MLPVPVILQPDPVVGVQLGSLDSETACVLEPWPFWTLSPFLTWETQINRCFPEAWYLALIFLESQTFLGVLSCLMIPSLSGWLQSLYSDCSPHLLQEDFQ